MSWGPRVWSFDVAFGLDLFGAAILFGQFSLSISSMCLLVRDGKDGPLRLRNWQRSFLRWLEPKLSRAHCEGAVTFDRSRAQTVLTILGE